MKFYSQFQTKDEQDLFLYGLIDAEDVVRRRPGSRDSNGKQREGDFVGQKRKSNGGNSKTFKYHVLVGDERVKVCAAAFLSIFSVTEKRIRRIRQLKTEGKPVKDLRGVHTSNVTSPDILIKMHSHIDSFPKKITHYAGKEKTFLSSELNIKTMYELFLKDNPEVKVSYQTYWAYFNEHFNLSFGQPQVDTCCTCEGLKVKIKSPHLNDVAKRTAVAELAVHVRRSKKFYSCIKKDVEDAKEKQNCNVLSLAIDYMQNISLPKIPVQELFYMRQLTVSLLSIHDIKKNTATIYVYHEGQAKKSPDETCSFLIDFLSKVPPEYDQINFYSDNCGGQNKNHCFSKLFLALTDSKRFKKINQYFPVRGHSFLPCDRDFSIIKRSLRKHDRIYSLPEISEIITKSSKTQKFLVVIVENSSSMIYDVKNWWPVHYKRNVASEETKKKPKSERTYFNISKFHHFEYDSETTGKCVAREIINGVVQHTFSMRKNTIEAVLLPTKFAYPTGKVPIKATKVSDLQKCMGYIPSEHVAFYNELLEWPQDHNNDGGAENVDEKE